MLLRWITTFVVLSVCVIAEALFAWQNGWLTYAQMRAQGIEQGIFFLGHPGMWMDWFVINALIATIVAKYGAQWKKKHLYPTGILALIVSFGMHYQYAQDTFPTAFGSYGKISSVGVLHFFYMTAVLAIIALFYTCTRHLTKRAVYTVSILLFVHVVIGVYVPLKLWTPAWFPQHGIFNMPTLVPIGVSVLLLDGLSWFALRRKGLPNGRIRSIPH